IQVVLVSEHLVMHFPEVLPTLLMSTEAGHGGFFSVVMEWQREVLESDFDFVAIFFLDLIHNIGAFRTERTLEIREFNDGYFGILTTGHWSVTHLNVEGWTTWLRDVNFYRCFLGLLGQPSVHGYFFLLHSQVSFDLLTALRVDVFGRDILFFNEVVDVFFRDVYI